MKPLFDHERLKVYQTSIAFNGWVCVLLGKVTAKAAVKDQLDRAATSIPLNIAEGNGKFSLKDRARYFDIARGSSLESASCLDVLIARELCSTEDVLAGKQMLFEVVNMLMGLLRRLGYDFQASTDGRLQEEPGDFREQEQEQEKE